MIILFATSTPAAAPIVVGLAKERWQDARFWFASSGLFTNTFNFPITSAASSTNTQQINRVQIYPGNVTLNVGQSVVLYVMISDTAIKSNSRGLGVEMLREAVRIAEKISDQKIRAGSLLGAAAVLHKVEPIEAEGVVRTAIKALNRQSPKDESRFSVLIKVPLSCKGEDDSWYGEPVSLPNSNIFETLVLLSKRDTETTLLMAQNLGDAETRIRAIASIVRSVIGKQTKVNNKTASN